MRNLADVKNNALVVRYDSESNVISGYQNIEIEDFENNINLNIKGDIVFEMNDEFSIEAPKPYQKTIVGYNRIINKDSFDTRFENDLKNRFFEINDSIDAYNCIDRIKELTNYNNDVMKLVEILIFKYLNNA